MATQKELKQRYAEILAADVWHNDQKMVDYCVKKAGYIVELEDGSILAIEKPSIEKNFCFGYSDSRYDTEDYDRANAMAAHAKESTEYFMKENMRDINNMIASLEGNSDYLYHWVHRIRIPYSGQPADSKLKAIHTFQSWDENAQKYPALEGENLRRVIEGYKIVKADFEKRLQTYLKRYGLSKVNSWSYWQDA